MKKILKKETLIEKETQDEEKIDPPKTILLFCWVCQENGTDLGLFQKCSQPTEKCKDYSEVNH